MEEREMAFQPTDTKPSLGGRLFKEMSVYDLLDNLKIPYEILEKFLPYAEHDYTVVNLAGE